MKKARSPFVIIIFSFIILIILGTILLMLPFATSSNFNLKLNDAIFTATSAVCVTGLLSVPAVTGVFTLFGKIVIILLIEIGGLGFVTISIFILSLLGVKLGISSRFLVKETLNQNSLRGLIRLVRFTVIVTLIIQSLGAIINFFVFIDYYDFIDALGISIFHSISSFNNAGFDLFPSGSSLIPFKNNIVLNLNTSLLIFLGGIGFITIYDFIKNLGRRKLSINTRIVLKTSILLILIGMIIIKIGEGNNISWLQAFFNSVSARTAGFSTIDYNTFSNTSLLVIIILMYIGASPSSTGGGIKTTTFYVSTKYILPLATGKQAIVNNRKIANESFLKAFVLIVISIAYILIIIILISFIERFSYIDNEQYNYFTKIVFEVFSAFGTVGNSMGITSNLHWLSKMLLVLTMICGRLGPITIISALNKHKNIETSDEITYLEEKIIIG